MKEERQQILYKKKRTSDGWTRREADGIAVEVEGWRPEEKEQPVERGGGHKRLREEE